MEMKSDMELKQININNIHPHLRLINLYPCSEGFNSGARRLYDHYFLYIHKGKGEYIIGDKTYRAVTGDLFYCPPGVSNTIIADQRDPFLLSGINFDFTQKYCDNPLLYPIQAELFNAQNVTEFVEFIDFKGFDDKFSLPNDNSVREIILEMIDTANTQKKYTSLHINGLLQVLISKVLHHIGKQELNNANPTKGDEIIKYISNHFRTEITNSSIAQVFHYNPDYINKVVLMYTGVTIKQYVIDLRVREAIQLLHYTNMDIGSIALQVGFSSVHYFSRIFKNKTGLPPSYLRQNQ